MAKAATVTKTEVTTTQPNSPAELKSAPAFLAKYTEDKKKGYSEAAEDRLVPFISLLHTLSPQLKPKNEKFVKGAEFGDIYLKNHVHPIIKPEVGITVQPCAYDHCWVEWVPRGKGGGFVTRHKDKPNDVEERPNPEDPTRVKLYRKSTGNEILETRYQYVRMNGRAYVMSFTSTGHTFWKNWNELMIAVSEGEAAFSHTYKLVPKLNTKGDQEWFQWTVEDGSWVWVDEANYLEGQKFCKSVESGLKVAEDDEREDGAGEVKASF